MSGSPRNLIVALAIALPGCNPSQELGLSHIPPVLRSDLNLESTDAQAHEFEFRSSGRYELRYVLKLRHGPGSSPDPYELAGLITIHDADRRLRLEEPFREELGPNQVGGVLLSFDSDAVAGHDPHTLSVQLEAPPPGLIDHYMGLLVFLKRQPAFPLLD